MENMTITKFIERFINGDFDRPFRNVQIEAGWYDWFCKDSSLAAKTQYLGRKVVAIKDSRRFDNDKCYVFFKNNCPMVGKLYDHFSICDMESGDVLFCCQHLEKGSQGCDKAHWEIYDRNVGFDTPVVNGSWRDVLNYFNK